MNEKRRKGEPNGQKLTPGERAKNWASAAVTAWPIMVTLLGLLGWSNAERIAQFALQEADGQTEVIPGGVSFEESVARHAQEINARVDDLEGVVAVQKADLSAEDRKNLQILRKKLADINVRLMAVEELVN